MNSKPSSKITAQGVLTLVITAATAFVTAAANGVTLEAGPAAGLVAAVGAVLVATGYIKKETNPSSSMIDAVKSQGL